MMAQEPSRNEPGQTGRARARTSYTAVLARIHSSVVRLLRFSLFFCHVMPVHVPCHDSRLSRLMYILYVITRAMYSVRQTKPARCRTPASDRPEYMTTYDLYEYVARQLHRILGLWAPHLTDRRPAPASCDGSAIGAALDPPTAGSKPGPHRDGHGSGRATGQSPPPSELVHTRRSPASEVGR